MLGQFVIVGRDRAALKRIEELCGVETEDFAIAKSAAYTQGGDMRDDAGDTVDYTITVTNNGNVTLTGLAVTDALSDATGAAITPALLPVFDSADAGSAAGTLKPGEVATYLVDYDITESDITTGGLSNIASVTADAPGGASASATSAAAVTPLTAAPEVSTIKTAVYNNGDGVDDLAHHAPEGIHLPGEPRSRV